MVSLEPKMGDGLEYSPLFYPNHSRCPPCRSFTPILSEFYNECAKPMGLEIIFVSSDRDEESFRAYFSKMPWLALPLEAQQIRNELSSAMHVRGIPSLVILNANTGHFVTDNARDEVARVGCDVAKGKELIASWKSKEAVPLELAKFGASGPSGLMGIVVQLLRNPFYVVFVYYILSFILKKFTT